MLTTYNSVAIKCANTLACAANLTEKYCTMGTLPIIPQPIIGSQDTLFVGRGWRG